MVIMARGPRNHIAYYNRSGVSNKDRAPGFAFSNHDFVRKITGEDGIVTTMRTTRNLLTKRSMTTVSGLAYPNSAC